MRARPLWIVLALLILPLALVMAGWWTLPRSEGDDPCGSVSRIEPSEASGVALSTTLRSTILDKSGGPFRMRATDVELTSYLARNIQGRQLADPQIHLLDDTDNTVCLSGHIVGLGLFTPYFRVNARPYVANGDIQFEIRYFVLNGRLLPVWIRRLAQRVTNETIRDLALPLRIKRVQVHHGEIVLVGEKLPAPR